MPILTAAIFLIAIIAIIGFAIKQKAINGEKEINRLVNLQNVKLLALNNRKKKIIRIATHDLSTPFASIDMWNQVLESSSTSWNEDQKKSFGMIHEGIAYGQKLLRKIAELENVIPDKISIDTFDFGAFANAIIENVRSSSDKNFQWHLKIAKPVYLLSDATLIKKMCEAILANAVDNTKVNGRINVTLQNTNHEIFFQVKNDVIDISKNKIGNLFSDYKEISNKENAAAEISKLSIAQRIVEELDGSISSENQNDGSAITIKFKN